MSTLLTSAGTFFRSGFSVRTKLLILSYLIIAITLYWCGWISYKYTHTPEVQAPTISNVKEKIVYRDYPSMSNDELINKLMCYDTAPFQFSYKPISSDMNSILVQNTYRLCDRTGSHDVLIPISTSGNWKYYVGAGVVIGVVVTASIIFF